MSKALLIVAMGKFTKMAAGGNTQVRRAYTSCTVTIALIKGVTIAFCCRAGKIPDNHICFQTSLEPDKVYSRSIGNNKGVATTFFPARNIPISLHFLLLVLLVLGAALPSPTATPVTYYFDPPFHKPGSQNNFLGGVGYYCHGNISRRSRLIFLIYLLPATLFPFADWDKPEESVHTYSVRMLLALMRPNLTLHQHPPCSLERREAMDKMRTTQMLSQAAICLRLRLPSSAR